MSNDSLQGFCRSVFSVAVATVMAGGLVGPSAAVDLLTHDQFSERCAETVRSRVAGAQVSVAQPLRLEVRGAGESATVPLDDAYQAYLRVPDKLDEIVKLLVDGVLESQAAAIAIDRTLIVPVVRERTWFADVGAEGGVGLVYDDLNDDLVVVYAEDAPNSLSYFSPVELQKAGIVREGLRQLAAENLLRILPQIERRGENGMYQIQAGGDFESSLLAIGSMWRKESFDVKGDFVFAVPAAGVLFVTGSEDPAGIASVRKLAAESYKRSPQKLSPKLFVLREGVLVALPE